MDITGIGIGRSIAIGPIIRMAPALKEPEDITNSQGRDSLQEVDRAQTSLKKVAEDLRLQAKHAQGNGMNAGKTQEILEALAQMAADPALLESITRLIEQGKTAERAVFEGFSGFEQTLTALGGYMAERAGDLHDVGQRVIADLLNIPVPGVPTSDHPFVLVAQDLSPADTAALDMSKILAIVTAQGGPTSHTAILARARGITTVVSAARSDELVDGTLAIVNAAKGIVTANPTQEEIETAKQAQQQSRRAKSLRNNPGCLKDGTRIPLLANIAKPEDADTALEYGAEGVGLFRTEFLFLGNDQPPSVKDQTAAYTALLSRFPGKKVVIRMLDAGADKPLPFLSPEDEPNPALGLRGLRTLKTHMQVLEDQLEAIVQADQATDADLWVMAPMIADQYETAYFVNLGKSKGLKFVGAMAEVPSIALMAQEVAQVADFVSIGTNDLTQYTLAADRTLGSVAHYQTAWHPAVLRAIQLIANAGKAHNMPVGVCGEAAADPDLAVVLVGLGVTSLSMTAMALDDVRAQLASCTLQEAQVQARKALSGALYHPAE
jgi:phosphotransferase system enzyme I (PtsI)